MLIYSLQHLYAVFILTKILLKVIKMSIFKGITKRNFIKDYDEKDGLPFFLMEDFESLDCDENAKRKMTETLQDMYPKFVEILKDESSYYSLIEKFYAKIMIVDTKQSYYFTEEQRHRIYKATQNLTEIYQGDRNYFQEGEEISDFGYWYGIQCTPCTLDYKDKLERDYGMYCSIKTYLCVLDHNKMDELFTEIVEELSKTGHVFNAKVSAYKRKDTMCLWVIPQILHVVKDFAKRHANDLCTPLPFVPFDGYVGLSKEFTISFNEAITTLISSYFLTISDVSEISVEGLLKNYLHTVFTPLEKTVDSKNRRLYLERNLRENLKHLHMREHIILLDSFNAILSGKTIGELKELHETQLEDGDMFRVLNKKYGEFDSPMYYIFSK